MSDDAARRPAWRRYLRFWGSDIPNDVDDELRFHIEMRVNEYIAQGMTPDDARRLAAKRFGSVDRARDACVVINEQHARSENRIQLLSTLHQDATFAARLLRRHVLQSVVAATCLALGIGATTTMFSVGTTILLRPMPFPTGDRVVAVFSRTQTGQNTGHVSSYPDFVDWRTRAHSFEEMGAIGSTSFTFLLTTPLRATGGIVTPSFFRVLGARAESGRLFVDDDDRPGAPKILVVSHSFAEQRLGGAANAVGKMFTVNGQQRLVVGVIADQWRFPSTGQVWAPPLDGDFRRTSRGNRNMEVFALMKRGTTIDAARREMTALMATMARENAGDDSYITTALAPLRERYVGSSRASLIALSFATILVLLVACTNVAALQVARAVSRAREIALRTALGANRSRIVRQLLTESVLLAVIGGAAGVGVAVAGTRYVASAIAASAPPWMTFGLDGRALAFTLVVSMLVGIAFGVAPALRLARIDPGDALRGGQSALGLSHGSLQRVFVASEIALSVILVIGALLAIESVMRLQNVPLGLDPTGVVSFRLSLQGPRYDVERERGRVISEFEHRIAAIPGVDVDGAGATTYVPISGCCSQFGTGIEGRPTDAAHMLMVTGNMITPGFFRSVRMPLLAGRDFTDSDNEKAPKVAIISETFAKKFWPAGDAIGHRIDTGTGMGTIVGIVSDIKQASLTDAPEPQFYRPHLQDPWSAMTFTVRVRGENPERIIPDVRRVMRELDPTLPVYAVQTLQKLLVDQVRSPRSFGILFASFAVVALLLASAGVYATMSFFVSQRTRELGLRVALGAEPSEVVSLIMRQGAFLAVSGGIVGVLLGIVAARALSHTLYGVTATEPLVYVAAAVVLVVAASFASYWPARRASTIDPMIALRAE
jgi:putative ABC transport system permease protein